MSEASLFAPDAAFLLLALCVALAYTAEAATGFGSIVIAVTLGAQLYPIPALLPLLVPLSVMLTLYLVSRHWRHVDVRLLLRRILPVMGVGVAIGFALFVNAPAGELRLVLGVFVVGVALLELRRLLFPGAGPVLPLSRPGFGAAALAAGVIHGLTASGGPVLVYALNRSELPKARFRATLSVVWLTLNGALVVSYLATGRLGASQAPFVLALVPVVVLAIALGEWLHQRFDEAAFRKAVLTLLAVAGLALLI